MHRGICPLRLGVGGGGSEDFRPPLPWNVQQPLVSTSSISHWFSQSCPKTLQVLKSALRDRMQPDSSAVPPRGLSPLLQFSLHPLPLSLTFVSVPLWFSLPRITIPPHTPQEPKEPPSRSAPPSEVSDFGRCPSFTYLYPPRVLILTYFWTG